MGQHHVTLSRYIKGRAEEGSEAIYFGLTPNEVSVVKRATYIFGQAHMYAMHIVLILILIRLSGVGSRGEQLKQGAPDFPFPGHIDQL